MAGTDADKILDREFDKAIPYFVSYAIARDEKFYKRVIDAIEVDKKNYRKKLLEKRKIYEETRFSFAMSEATALRTYKLYCMLCISGFDRLSPILWKKFPKYRLAIEQKKLNETPPSSFFMDRMDAGIFELSANFSVYIFMIQDYCKRMQMQEASVEIGEPDKQLHFAISYAVFVFSSVKEDERSQKVDALEQFYRKKLTDLKLRGTFRDYISVNEELLLGSVISPLTSMNRIMEYRYTDDDYTAVAHRMFLVLQTRDSTKKIQEKDTRSLSDKMNDHLNTPLVDDSGIYSEDIKFFLLAYTIAKVNSLSRTEMLDDYIASIDTTSKDDFVSREQYNSEKREHENTRRQLDRKQRDINEMQMKIDKYRQKNSELHDKIHELEKSLKEYQKLVDTYNDDENHEYTDEPRVVGILNPSRRCNGSKDLDQR